MSFGDIVTGLRSALSGGAPAWALLFAAMMWIGGGMGAGMGMIDVQFPFLFIEELNWSDTEYLALKGGLITLATLLGVLTGGELGRRFGMQNTMVGHHCWCNNNHSVVLRPFPMGRCGHHDVSVDCVDFCMGYCRQQCRSDVDESNGKQSRRHPIFSLHDVDQCGCTFGNFALTFNPRHPWWQAFPNLFLIGAVLQFSLLFPLSKIRNASIGLDSFVETTESSEYLHYGARST